MKTKVIVISLIIIFTLNGLTTFDYIKNCQADEVLPKLYVDLTYDSSTPGWNVTHFNSIQSAIDSPNCNPGDRIIVYNGEYTEKILINESISLFGEDAEKTIINGQGSGDVVTINNSYVDLSTFTIKNSGSGETNAGVKVNADNCRIIENIISGCKNGIFITAYNTTTIAFNSIKDNSYGIYLSSTYKNIIESNKIYNNNYDGIFFNENCSNNNINGNKIYDNKNGNGLYLNKNCDNNTISNNEVYSNKIIGIRIENSSDNKIIDGNNIRSHSTFYGIMIVGSNNSIKDSIIQSNKHGIFLLADNRTTIYNNTITDNALDGIRLQNSTSNEIHKNTITYNDRYGLYLNYFSINNYIYNNLLTNNEYNAWDISISDNFWNKEEKNVKNIIGGKNINGNYWDDYTGVDEKSGPKQDQSGSDGIGDTPYNILPGNKKDYKPLVPRNPIANANGIYTAYLGQTITFDGSKSSDPDGNALNYSWNFGDKTTGFGKKINHKYTSVGEYTVILTVTNSYGKTDTNTTKAIILKDTQPPTITIEKYGPSDNYLNSFTFKVKVIDNTEVAKVTIEYWYEDSDHVTVDMDEEGGNDYKKVIIPSGKPSQVYCIIYAIDTSGNKNDTKNPFANPGGPYHGVVAGEITFDGKNSFDLDGNIVSYSWDFGDGTSGTESLTTHVYSTNGNYTVTLTVTDNEGKTGSDTTYANITEFPQTKTSVEILEYLKNKYDINLTELFYSFDSNGDGIQDGFYDPNKVLKSIHTSSINISGDICFLISINDSYIPEFIWNATENKIVLLSYVSSSISETTEDENSDSAIVKVKIQKTDGWIFFDVEDKYPKATQLNVKKNDVSLNSDRFWRKNKMVYVLDDPEVEYQLIYSDITPSPALSHAAFNPASGATIGKDSPNITISYTSEVEIVYVDFYNISSGEGIFTSDGSLVLITDDNKTFRFTPPANLKSDNYRLDIFVEDQDGNSVADYANYKFFSYAVSEEGIKFSWMWVMLIGGVGIACAIFLFLASRYKFIKFESFIYVRNKKILPFFKPVVFGPFSLDINDKRVSKAEFYVNGKLKDTVTQEPYTMKWDEKAFMKQTIEAKVYDENGNSSTTGEMTFYVFNPPKLFK